MLTGLNINHKAADGVNKRSDEIQDEIRLLVGATEEDEANVAIVKRDLRKLGKGMQEYMQKMHPVIDKAVALRRRGAKVGHFGTCGCLHRLLPMSGRVSSPLQGCLENKLFS
jgi:hypothetical protein